MTTNYELDQITKDMVYQLKMQNVLAVRKEAHRMGMITDEEYKQTLESTWKAIMNNF